MALRDILVIPDKRLRLVSEPVESRGCVHPHASADDMFETMYEAPGIGLAAIQIGEPLRVVTMDLAKKDDPKEPLVFINPEIVWSSDEIERPRGRLPVDPRILRGGRAAGEGQGSNISTCDGKPQEVDAEGLLATCLQHEIDHLNGVLFIDHISKLKRDRVIKKFTKGEEIRRESSARRRQGSSHRSAVRYLIFMGTPDSRGADACVRDRRRAATRSRRSTTARAEAAPGRGMDMQVTPVGARARKRFGSAGADAEDLARRSPRRRREFRRASMPTPRWSSPTA